MRKSAKSWAALFATASAVAVAGCASTPRAGNTLPAANLGDETVGPVADSYIIGPADELTLFVWRNQELSVTAQVRPDGRITTPLITDMVAAGKTPAQLADDVRAALAQYIQEPLVSVIVNRPQGSFSQQVRIVGAAVRPTALPYRANMTVLDAMIAAGGLGEFAAGDRAKLIRVDRGSGEQREYDLHLNRLLRRGDIRANVRLEPGDVIIIPESMF